MYKGKRYGIPLDIHTLAHVLGTGPGSEGRPRRAADGPRPSYRRPWPSSRAGSQPVLDAGRWPAHLMFLSLLWQFGGEPFDADVTKATFDSDAASRR